MLRWVWLAMVGNAAFAAQFATVDIPDLTANVCEYQNLTTGEVFDIPVEVDPARGRADYGYRVCKADTVGWPVGVPMSVSFKAKRTATGEVSTALTGTLPGRAQVQGFRLVADVVVPPPPPPTEVSLWPDTAPTGVTDGGVDSAATVGVRFTPSVPGKVLGLRFYKYAGNTGAHIGNLWSNTGTKLATVTFAGETASGWQKMMFATPVSVAAGTTYVASYQALAGHYAFTANYFATPYTAAPLAASAGLYKYGAAPVFPNLQYQSGNYWVDIVFKAD